MARKRKREASLLLMRLVVIHFTVVVGTATASRHQLLPECLTFQCPSQGAVAAPSRTAAFQTPRCGARYLLSQSCQNSPPFSSSFSPRFCPVGSWGCIAGTPRGSSTRSSPSSSTRARSSVLEGAASAAPGASSRATASAMLLDGLEEDEKSRRRVHDGGATSATSSSSSRGGRATRRLSLLDVGEGGAAAWTRRARAASIVAEETEECEVLWDGARVTVGEERGIVKGGGAVAKAVVGSGADAAPLLWSKPVTKNDEVGAEERRFRVVVAGQRDLDEAGALCIKVFFGEADSPWKAAQLRQLAGEQRQDLESRCNREESVMFKAVDTLQNEKMVGFIEVSAVSGSKYGMGSGVPLANTRPVISNLAVDPGSRRCGIGTALMDACQDMIKTWNFEEIILQVEEDNEAALAFYGGLGFDALFVDRAARRYDTSGFLLQNVRTSKLTMRKTLSPSRSPRAIPTYTVRDQLCRLLTFVMKPFVATPDPSTVSSAARRGGAESIENLFGAPGVGRSPRSEVLPGSTQQYPPAVRLHRTRP